MSRACRALATLAGIAVASAPRAFVQEKSSTSGVPVSWPSVPVTYKMNMSAFQGGCASAAAAATIARSSVTAWQKATRSGESSACTSFSFSDGGDTTATALGNDGTNLIVVRNALCSSFRTSDPTNCADPTSGACIEAHNCWSHDSNTGSGAILALTTVTSSTRAGASTGNIIDADMEINGWNGSLASPTGLYFTCVDPPPMCTADYGQQNCSNFDLASTVTHEAGHMLGLDHTPVAGATMAPTAAKGETEKRTLAADDIEGVCTIYPVGRSSSGGGCGAGAGGVLSLAALALLLGRQRRSASVRRVR